MPDIVVDAIGSGASVYRVKHEIGDTVYLAVEPFDERSPGMVTALHVRPGLITYGVTWADTRTETVHQAIELVAADGDDA